MLTITMAFLLGCLVGAGALAFRSEQKTATTYHHDYDEIASAYTEVAFADSSQFAATPPWDWDEPFSLGTENVTLHINPATGLMMTGSGVDVGGNPYGLDLTDT